MPISEEMVQSLPQIQVHGTSRRGGGSGARGEYCHFGRQFPLCNDTSHHHLRCGGRGRRLLFPSHYRDVPAAYPLPDLPIDLSGDAYLSAAGEQ